MHSKDRLSAFMCTNADGTAKVDMAIIGKAKNPRCFKIAPCPLKYFSQANAWSDSITFRKWWKEVFTHSALDYSASAATHGRVLITRGPGRQQGAGEGGNVPAELH